MYAYQADLYCDTCGNAIARDLPRSDDSDDYPQWYDEDHSETDCPNHCASYDDCPNAEVLPDGSKVGALLREQLTSDGRAYVQEAIYESLSEHGKLTPVVELWADTFGGLTLPYDNGWNRWDIALGYAALAHDFGLYGVADRLQRKLRLSGPYVGDTSRLEEGALNVYVTNWNRARRTGPWDKRLAK